MAIGAGVVLGAISLVARYAPALSAFPALATAARSRAEPAAPSGVAALVSAPAAHGTATGSGGAAARAPSVAAAPVDRFAADPAASAACPGEMTLVDGEFCPSLAYVCARRGDGIGYGCPEYARGARCREPTDHRRFCVDRYEWPNRVGELPRVYVDWFEAKALCSAAGKRLCRRSEWTLACEGPKRLPYPWGFVRTPSPCNIDRASIDFDIGAIVEPSTREDEITRLWQADPIGSHPHCISAFGAYDLSGNVDEWTDNQADDPATRHPATLNGGYWGPVRNTCRLATSGHGPNFKFYQVGFRCCADTIDGIQTPPPRPFVERPQDEGGVYD
jgi:formylglycine-generating enzyme